MKFSIQNAREASKAGNYCVAVLNYLTVLQTLPSERRKDYVKELCDVLSSVVWEQSDLYKDKKLIFALSREIFPTDPNVLVLSMQYLYHSGDLFGALQIAKDSYRYCKDDEQYLSVLVNEENIKSHMFDQWHWAMLNDEERNRSYLEAISLAVGRNSDCRVLDIGGGTALLSIYASRYSNHVYCCEMSRNMCSLAEKIIEGNDKIRLIQKHSTDLSLEQLDFQRVDIVVTETMDSGLFGEKIVSSLLDAHRRFVKQKSLIIPRKATVFGVLVECEQIFLENVLIKGGIRFISRFVKCGSATPKEPYCCTYMNEIKGGYSLLSEPVKLLEVDFTDVNCLKLFREGFSTTVQMCIGKKGLVHAVITWFCCELFPGVPLLSSGPNSNSCWQQAIFPFPIAFSADIGDHFSVALRVYEDRIDCELLNPSSVERLSCSTVATLNSNKQDALSIVMTGRNQCLPKSASPSSCRTIRPVSGPGFRREDTVTMPIVLESTDFLYANDYALEAFFFNSFLNVFQPSFRIVDLTNLSSVSLKLESSHCFYKALCIYRNSDYRIIMESCSDPKRNKITPLQSTEFPCTADIILFWPLNSSGYLCEVSLNQIIDMKIVNPDAIIIPSCIKVTGCIVSCAEIVRRSKLNPNACNGVDLSLANNLAVSYYYDIEISTLKYQPLSDPCELMCLQFDCKIGINSARLPDFLQQYRRSVQLMVVNDGDADGILFWYTASFRSHTYSSAAKETNARCAMFVFKEQRCVHSGESLPINTSLYHGNFVIEERE